MANQSAVGPTWCFSTSSTVSTPTPTPTPAGPIQLLLDSSGPAVDQVAALDSTRLLRDPFPVLSGASLLNAGSDGHTRVILFVRNLALAQGEPASAGSSAQSVLRKFSHSSLANNAPTIIAACLRDRNAGGIRLS